MLASKCTLCEVLYPAGYLSTFHSNARALGNVCGVCALALSNAGLPASAVRTEFTGTRAEQMRKGALEYRSKTEQTPRDWEAELKRDVRTESRQFIEQQMGNLKAIATDLCRAEPGSPEFDSTDDWYGVTLRDGRAELIEDSDEFCYADINVWFDEENDRLCADVYPMNRADDGIIQTDTSEWKRLVGEEK